jgi:multicomponent Na+:H+ antiporter subunit A
MVVGIVDHQAGTRDIRQLSGLGPAWRPVKWAAIIAAGSMAGLPPMLGFIAKEKALDGALNASFGGHQLLVVVMVIGSILTFGYSSRFILGLYGSFAVKDVSTVTVSDHRQVDAHGLVLAPHLKLALPSLLLSLVALVTGILPVLLSDLVVAATRAMYSASQPRAVALWAGWNTAFTLSLFVVAVGIVLTIMRSPVYRGQKWLQEKMKAVPSADENFWLLLASLIRFAKRTTRVVQNGSLPIYLMVILSVMALASLIPLWNEIDGLPALIGPGVHLAPLGFIIVAAIAATRVTHRLVAVLFLGAVGFGMAGFYVIEGAPDLALTQFSIETLATVLFVLVLRVLPQNFDNRRDAIMAPLRIAVAVLVGTAVFVFALVAAQSRQDISSPSISQEMIARSLPDAQGANVVNVILVDFRGLDTLGEITVLLVAALGVVALSRGSRRNLVARSSMETSQVIDAATRLLFTSIVVLSVYFLFAGHNQPGGGFVGGLVVGAALSFRFIAGGLPAVRNTVRVPARLVLGGGLALAIGTALIPIIFGGSILEHASLKLDLPIFG